MYTYVYLTKRYPSKKIVCGCLESANDARGRPKKSEHRSPGRRPPRRRTPRRRSPRPRLKGDVPEAEPQRQRSPQRPREKTAEAKNPKPPRKGTPLRNRVSGLGMSRQTPRAGLSRRSAVIQRGSPFAGGSEDPGTAKKLPRPQHASRAPHRGVSKGQSCSATRRQGQ